MDPSLINCRSIVQLSIAITIDFVANSIHVPIQDDSDCVDCQSPVNILCCDANEEVEKGEREHESQREEEKEIKSENNLGLEFDLTQFSKTNTGCTCDYILYAIFVEINSCINSMPLESAYFPLIADDFGYEHIVSTDFFDNVHTPTQLKSFLKFKIMRILLLYMKVIPLFVFVML